LTATLLVLHLGALLFGGGFAVAADRGTRAAARDSDAEVSTQMRARQLVALAELHPLVMRALWISIASGLALFALHAERYVTSGVFWVKMALVVALLANGLVMQIAERDAREASPSAIGAGAAAVWGRLRASAVASTALWALVLVAGVLLTYR